MKKVLTLILAAGLFTFTFTGMAAGIGDENDDAPLSPHYLSVTGTVVSIDEYESDQIYIRINIEDADGNPAVLMINNERTVYPFESECEVGDVVTGYYLAGAPMIMIWPPQYSTVVLIAGIPEGNNVKADRFTTMEDRDDGYMISGDGMFAFRIDEETEIILADGRDFSDGDIEGRRLVVIYDISTRSIPEFATARKVIVLFEDIVPLPEVTPVSPADVSAMPMLVDGERVEAPAAFTADDGAVMVPLRAIAEALGYTVGWIAGEKAVTLDETIKIVIGQTAYQQSEMRSIVIDGAPAPALRDNITYVPLAFFGTVLEIPEAEIKEGQIVFLSEVESAE